MKNWVRWRSEWYSRHKGPEGGDRLKYWRKIREKNWQLKKHPFSSDFLGLNSKFLNNKFIVLIVWRINFRHSVLTSGPDWGFQSQFSLIDLPPSGSLSWLLCGVLPTWSASSFAAAAFVSIPFLGSLYSAYIISSHSGICFFIFQNHELSRI